MDFDMIMAALYDYGVVIPVVVAVAVAAVGRARIEIHVIVVSIHDDLIVIAMVVMMW